MVCTNPTGELVIHSNIIRFHLRRRSYWWSKERHVLSPGRLIVELRPPTGTLSLYMEHWKNHADKGKSKYSVKNLSQCHSFNADLRGQKFN